MAARGGFALVLCIVLTLGLSMFTAAMLAMAMREQQVATAASQVTAARVHAESAARLAFVEWSTGSLRDIPVGGDRLVLDGADRTVVAERLGSSFFLLRAEARIASNRGDVRARTGLLVRAVHPALLGVPEAAVAVAGRALLMGGSLSGHDLCTDTIVAAVAADSVTGDPGTEMAGGIGHTTDLAEPLLIEGFPLAEMATVTQRPGAVSPRPVVRGGTCDARDENWGTSASGHPCAGRIPLVHVDGDLSVRGGEGQGMLVTEGNLTLRDGFRFAGVVLVGGILRIDDAAITGQVRAGSFEMHGGRVQYSSCSAARALEGPAFDRAFRPAGRWWVPIY